MARHLLHRLLLSAPVLLGALLLGFLLLQLIPGDDAAGVREMRLEHAGA